MDSGLIRIHVTSLLYANLFYQALEQQITTILPEARANLSRLLHMPAPESNRTHQPWLWHLAQLLTADEHVQLAAGGMPTQASKFTVELEHFLARHGHRASASWEIFSPRWRDQADILIPLLLAQSSEDPRARQENQRNAERRARLRLRKHLGRGPKLWGLNAAINLTQRQLLLRENQRYYFDQILYATQQNLLRLGTFLMRRGCLDHQSDIAYLTVDEAKGLTSKKLSRNDTEAWIARRRTERNEASLKAPPVFLEGNEGVPLTLEQGRLEGLGISSGRTRGVVRIIHRLEEANRLQPGEILVTRTVDPGWTPLFTRAGGLILELGSILSHGAVVAREYGIPAVVNIESLTSRLRDGQEVTVDGNRGLVWIHS